jgi:toxin-antitoxin system PIN domain toxin
MTRATTSDVTIALPDVNVLVALTNPSHVFHAESHRWLTGVERYATTPVTESGLLRMLLNRAVTGQPVTSEQAIAVLAGVRADSRAEFLVDDSSLAVASVDTTGLAGHKQVTDWHLLNLAARHDGHLVTFDRKLARAALPADAARVVTLIR